MHGVISPRVFLWRPFLLWSCGGDAGACSLRRVVDLAGALRCGQWPRIRLDL